MALFCTPSQLLLTTTHGFGDEAPSRVTAGQPRAWGHDDVVAHPLPTCTQLLM